MYKLLQKYQQTSPQITSNHRTISNHFSYSASMFKGLLQEYTTMWLFREGNYTAGAQVP